MSSATLETPQNPEIIETQRLPCDCSSYTETERHDIWEYYHIELK